MPVHLSCSQSARRKPSRTSPVYLSLLLLSFASTACISEQPTPRRTEEQPKVVEQRNAPSLKFGSLEPIDSTVNFAAVEPGQQVGYSVSLPAGWTLRNVVGQVVELRDAQNIARERIRVGTLTDSHGKPQKASLDVHDQSITWRIDTSNTTKWPVSVAPVFEETHSMLFPRFLHTASLLPDGRVVIIGGQGKDLGSITITEIYSPTTGTFSAGATLPKVRFNHTATVLLNGMVLVHSTETPDSKTADLYDADDDKFTELESTNAPGIGATPVLLSNGMVFFYGAQSKNLRQSTLFNPNDSSFTQVGPMSLNIVDHRATQLADGSVLIVGGKVTDQLLNAGNAEPLLVDPSTGATTPTGPTGVARILHTNTLLPDGRVLVAGGYTNGADGGSISVHNTTELYDPISKSFHPGPDLKTRLLGHRAVLQPDGKVLILGGLDENRLPIPFVQIFDPETNTISRGETLISPRIYFSSTILATGQTLVLGGDVGINVNIPVAIPELFNPRYGLVSATSMLRPRAFHTATTLLDGTILISGGVNTGAGPAGHILERYNPQNGLFENVLGPTDRRSKGAAATLPDGRVYFAGGEFGNGFITTEVDIYDPAANSQESTTPLSVPRTQLTAASLLNGKVIVAGGLTGLNGEASTFEVHDPQNPDAAFELPWKTSADVRINVVSSSQVLLSGGPPEVYQYNPETNAVDMIGQLITGTRHHTATALESGNILMAGGNITEAGTGNQVPVTHVEEFDTVTGTSLAVESMSYARASHTDTLLADGKVLLAGGNFDDTAGTPAEIYDPATKTFSLTGPMARNRQWHTASTLPDGKILFVGGNLNADSNKTDTAEVFDPATGQFTLLSGASIQRSRYAASALPTGDILISGGRTNGEIQATTLLYHPTDRSFSDAQPMSSPREYHTTILLPTGKVLFLGGQNRATGQPSAVCMNKAELYDPISGQFSATGQMQRARCQPAVTLLNTGRVLISGGRDDSGSETNSIEQYDPETGTFTAVQSTLFTARSGHKTLMLANGNVMITGGKNSDGDILTTEMYNPSTDSIEQLPITITAPQGTALSNGDALFAYNGGITRMSGDAVTTVNLAAVPSPVAIIPLLNGEVFVAGPNDSAVYNPANDSIYYVPNPAFDIAVRVPSGVVVGIGTGIAHYDARPPGVSLPVVTESPAEMSVNDVITVKGTGFTRLSFAAGSQPISLPSRIPQVVFSPADPSAPSPIVGKVESWSDTEITWRVPQTVYSGPGYLHVLNFGVWSDGKYVVLKAQPLGETCTIDAHCVTGFCTEGVCSDKHCAGECESIDPAINGQGTPFGVCQFIANGLPAKSGACAKDSSNPCGPVGTCNGIGLCTLPTQETQCDLEGGTKGNCIVGVCTELAVKCSDAGDAYINPDGSQVSCVPYVCDGGQCLETCENDSECSNGYICTEEQRCARCNDTNTKVELGSTTQDCSPYLCNLGACLNQCEQHGECAPNFRCSSTGQCIPDIVPTTSGDSGICSLSTQPHQQRSLAWLAAATLLAQLARKSRRSNSRLN